MRVSERWYGHLNEIGLGVSILFLISYILATFIFKDRIEVVELSVRLVPAVLAATTIAYIFIGFRLETKRSPMLAALGTITLLIAMIGSQVALTDDIQSLYMPLWVALVMLVGMFGWILLAVLAVITNVYVAVFGQNTDADTATTILYFLSIQVPFIVSWLLWHGTSDPVIDTSKFQPHKLTPSNDKANIVIESITEGVISVNHEQAVELVNPAAAQITEWGIEDAIGLNYNSIMRLIDPDTEEQITEADHPIAEAFRSGESHKIPGTLSLITRSDHRVPISINLSPVKNASSGVVESVVAVFNDITRDSIAERQRAEFISTASHEMRTPVAAIEGYLSLALNENVAKIDENARKYLNKAHDSTGHLGKLLKDLLTAAKSEDGRLKSNPSVIDVGEFLTDLSEDFRFGAQKKGLELRTAFSTVASGAPDSESKRKVIPLYYVHADPERLREVMTNLFDNAIKYTPEGSITIDLTDANNEVLISLTDTGIGISPDDRTHLFEKFYRVDSTDTREIGGTGLGLFICRQIVEMQGGRIWVKSAIGKGSTFFIALPRVSIDKANLLKKAEETTTAQ